MPSLNELPAMKVAIEICEEFAEQWEQQARGGDNTGASDHRADAARQIIAELRNVNASPTAVVLDDERVAFEAWMQRAWGYVDADTIGYKTALEVWQSRAAWPNAEITDEQILDVFYADASIDACAATTVIAFARRLLLARAASPRPVAQTERALTYPAEFTDELKWILGLICFQCIQYAQTLRKAGRDIPSKAEAEQAATIDWMLRHYLTDPENWRKTAADEMRAMAGVAQPSSGEKS